MLHGSIAALVLAVTMATSMRALTVSETQDACITGVRNLVDAMSVLFLAWAMGTAIGELGAAQFLVATLGPTVPAWSLPTLVFANDMPFADPATQEWIGEEVLPSGGGGGVAMPEEIGEAQKLFSSGKGDEGIKAIEALFPPKVDSDHTNLSLPLPGFVHDLLHAIFAAELPLSRRFGRTPVAALVNAPVPSLRYSRSASSGPPGSHSTPPLTT